MPRGSIEYGISNWPPIRIMRLLNSITLEPPCYRWTAELSAVRSFGRP
jgi:hypothetical protein